MSLSHLQIVGSSRTLNDTLFIRITSFRNQKAKKNRKGHKHTTFISVYTLMCKAMDLFLNNIFECDRETKKTLFFNSNYKLFGISSLKYIISFEIVNWEKI
ncbi:hypothetical protein BpHYR1_052121 [Brachionus plicatilis]|uniref:Uncharacterized protein n=1 Tax=Brachionus plicatilis TaxID=10195 RepID=A0A3M7RXR6_BRAPC|nr:hypothetical protein BpHYR1_052121 [Brachionus plicatilis]